MSRLPSVLKMMGVFVNGESYVGDALTVTLPKLTRKVETFTLGSGDIELDMGQEPIVIEHTYMGMCPPEILNGYGAPGLGREMVRWVGGYQNQDDGTNQAHEIVAVGSHKEIDPGDQKTGEKTETKVQTTCTYFKLSVNGQVRMEIDLLDQIFLVNGVDRYAELRQLVGL